MNKKCLIINGSPNINGNTNYLINLFIKQYCYEVSIVNAFPINNKGISSCIDCGSCCQHPLCILDDDFKLLTNDDYDLILIFSPIYMSNLPGPMINIINRFNFIYNNKKYLNHIPYFKQKKAGLILLGGGQSCKELEINSNEYLAIKQANYIFKNLNATLDDIILCLNTDTLKVKDNSKVIEQIKNLAKKYS